MQLVEWQFCISVPNEPSPQNRTVCHVIATASGADRLQNNRKAILKCKFDYKTLLR